MYRFSYFPALPSWWGPFYGSVLVATLLVVARRRGADAGTVAMTGLLAAFVSPSVSAAGAIRELYRGLGSFSWHTKDTAWMPNLVTHAWRTAMIGWCFALAALVATLIVVALLREDNGTRSHGIVAAAVGATLVGAVPLALLAVIDPMMLDIVRPLSTAALVVDKVMIAGVLLGYVIAAASAALSLWVSIAGAFANATRRAAVIALAAATLLAVVAVGGALLRMAQL